MQLHKEKVQELRRKHLISTIELQYEQLKTLHEMRTEHLNKQHALEWDNQISYSRKAERELRKKHVLELKQHPKSLKVNTLEITYMSYSANGIFMFMYFTCTCM